jgi:hypothetical protein
MATLFAVNARRKHKKARKSGKRRKHRTAAQRAATRRMISARRGHRRVRLSGRKGKRRVSMTYSINPRHHRRRYRRNPRFGAMFKGGAGGVVGLLKTGVIGGAGAVLTDVLMGYTSKVLPASFATPQDASGNVQFGYFGVKAALALLLGTQGRRFMPAPIATNLAEGALTVMAYQFIRPMMPSAIALGYLNPAPTMRPRVAGAGAYVKGVGAYTGIPVRAASAVAPGSRAASVVSMVNRGR